MADAAPCILGIDSGLTMTKAVVFDAGGRVLSFARCRIAQTIPQPRHVERDMVALWQATAQAIREALATAGSAADIVAVAATAHGDGVYLLDHSARPLGPGILSLDSRAGAIVQRWQDDGTASAALPLSGQMPHASAPSALLAWMLDHQPDRFALCDSRLGQRRRCVEIGCLLPQRRRRDQPRTDQRDERDYRQNQPLMLGLQGSRLKSSASASDLRIAL